MIVKNTTTNYDFISYRHEVIQFFSIAKPNEHYFWKFNEKMDSDAEEDDESDSDLDLIG